MFVFHDDSVGGRLQAKKDTAPKFRVDFDELAIKKDGDTIHCFFYAISCDAYALEDKKSKKKWEEPGLLYWGCEKNSQYGGEKVLYAYLDQLEEEKVYKGFISCDGAFVGADKALANAAQLEALKMVFFAAEEGVAEHLKLDSLSIPKRQSYGGGYKGETQAQKIESRAAFIKSLGEKPDEAEVIFTSAGMITGGDLTKEEKLNFLLSLIA